MAVVFVASAVAEVTQVTGNDIVVSKPTGTASGDIMIATIRSRNLLTAAPSGWTQQYADTGSTNGFIYGYSKVAGGSEPSTYTWSTSSNSGRMAGVINTYRGQDTTTPLGTQQHNTGTSGGTVVRMDGITPVVVNAMLAVSYGVNVTGVASGLAVNPALTARGSVGSNVSAGRMVIATGELLRTTTAATGSIDGSVTDTTITVRNSFVIPIHPLVVAPTDTSSFLDFFA